jgi:hypothetical protein
VGTRETAWRVLYREPGKKKPLGNPSVNWRILLK